MTIDQRLERLIERHEALAETVEIFAAENTRLQKLVEQDGEHIRALQGLVAQDGEHIRALARIAEIHERRISHLEGQ